MSKRNLIALGLVAALVAASLFLGYRWGRNSVEPEIITKTEYKTIRVKDPTPSLSYNTGKLIFVPVEATESQSDSTTHLTPKDAPTATPDSTEESIVVELPEEMREYRDSTVVNDSTKLYYHIGVKGYNPSLAFADFTLPYVTTTETIVKKKPPVEFGWGLVGGVGYGVINRKPDVFVGVGVSLNFNFGNSKRGR